MSLSYLEDLKERYTFGLTNGIIMNDYKQYISSYNEAITILNDKKDIPFIYATHVQEIDISQENTKFVTRIYEYVLGFYSDYYISFDLYIGDIFQNHYYVDKNKYVPLTKESGDVFIHCSLNCPNNNNALEIRNLTTTYDLCKVTEEIKLIFLGVILNYDERKETSTSGITEISINLSKKPTTTENWLKNISEYSTIV